MKVILIKPISLINKEIKMARRIKEEPLIHKSRIAEVAVNLFRKGGIENTSMDDIAKEAGYSKATLYVYFHNKNDIVNFIKLRSMEELGSAIIKKLNETDDYKKSFMELCFELVHFQEEYPDYFDLVLQNIDVNVSKEDSPAFVNEIYESGAEINNAIGYFIKEGIKKGALKPAGNIVVFIFQLWGMISGLIKLASEKEKYILLSCNVSKKDFLTDGFEKIYSIIKS